MSNLLSSQRSGLLPVPATPDLQPPLPNIIIPQTPPEFGGRKGPEPTRYGDWEKDGKCTDF